MQVRSDHPLHQTLDWTGQYPDYAVPHLLESNRSSVPSMHLGQALGQPVQRGFVLQNQAVLSCSVFERRRPVHIHAVLGH